MSVLFETIRQLVLALMGRNKMNIPGKKVKRTRLVRTERFVVAVEVEATVPEDDPSEACFEPSVVELLREVEDHAKNGDINWLKQRGKIYEAVGVE